MWKPARPRIDQTEKKQITSSTTEAGVFLTATKKLLLCATDSAVDAVAAAERERERERQRRRETRKETERMRERDAAAADLRHQKRRKKLGKRSQSIPLAIRRRTGKASDRILQKKVSGVKARLTYDSLIPVATSSRSHDENK